MQKDKTQYLRIPSPTNGQFYVQQKQTTSGWEWLKPMNWLKVQIYTREVLKSPTISTTHLFAQPFAGGVSKQPSVAAKPINLLFCS